MRYLLQQTQLVWTASAQIAWPKEVDLAEPDRIGLTESLIRKAMARDDHGAIEGPAGFQAERLMHSFNTGWSCPGLDVCRNGLQPSVNLDPNIAIDLMTRCA